MRICAYIAASVNGLITRGDDDTEFVADEDWERFLESAKTFGNLVVGRKTFEAIYNGGQIAKLGKVEVVVATHRPELFRAVKGANFVSGGPARIVEFLSEKGYTKMLLGGGAEIIASFATLGLIDEIVIDFEPWLLGEGKGLFGHPGVDLRLNLLDMRRLSQNEVQLKYEVIKESSRTEETSG